MHLGTVATCPGTSRFIGSELAGPEDSSLLLGRLEGVRNGRSAEELLACADQALYARKRASGETPSSAELMETKPAPLRVMVDLTCPHCQKMNSFAVIQNSGAGNTSRNEVRCAHC